MGLDWCRNRRCPRCYHCRHRFCVLPQQVSCPPPPPTKIDFKHSICYLFPTTKFTHFDQEIQVFVCREATRIQAWSSSYGHGNARSLLHEPGSRHRGATTWNSGIRGLPETRTQIRGLPAKLHLWRLRGVPGTTTKTIHNRLHQIKRIHKGPDFWAVQQRRRRWVRVHRLSPRYN